MNDILLKSINKLNDEIKNDQRVINLEQLSKEIDNSPEVRKLSAIMNEKASLYEDAIKHFGEESQYTKNCQKELYISKKNLDELPLVISYNKAYQQVRLLYEEINHSLFSPFQKKCGIDD